MCNLDILRLIKKLSRIFIFFKEKWCEMKNNVLLSIKPKYVTEILNNNKKYEYRKKIFIKDVGRVYIYSSSPQKKIVGYFEYKGYIEGTPLEIWEQTNHYSGISKADYFEYFRYRQKAYAIIIEKVVEYAHYINPREKDLSFVAPQSYKYVGEI